jgi:hypothetical protein
MKDLKNKESITKKTGDKLERTGEKLTNAGHTKIGPAVHDAGDKLEHMGEKKRSNSLHSKR